MKSAVKVDRSVVRRREAEILGVVSRHEWQYLTNRLAPEEPIISGAPPKPSLPRPKVVCQILTELGPTYVKLGQLLSTRPDLLPPEYVAALEELQSDVPPVPWEQIKPQLEEDLEQPIDSVFAEFPEEPLAAGSLGQVYRATLQNGETVAVKVQRPGIGQLVEADLEVMQALVNRFQNRKVGETFDLQGLLDEFSNSITSELDFRLESNNTLEMQQNLLKSSFWPQGKIRTARVYPEFSQPRLLVLEWVEGRLLLKADMTAEQRAQVADLLAQMVMNQFFNDGFFHADPHPGNFMFQHQSPDPASTGVSARRVAALERLVNPMELTVDASVSSEFLWTATDALVSAFKDPAGEARQNTGTENSVGATENSVGAAENLVGATEESRTEVKPSAQAAPLPSEASQAQAAANAQAEPIKEQGERTASKTDKDGQGQISPETGASATDFTLVLLDCGMAARLDPRTRNLMLDLFLGIIDARPDTITQALYGIGFPQEPVNLSAMESDIDRLLRQNYAKSLADLNLGPLIQDVLDIPRAYKIQLPGSIGLFLKAITNAEGVARGLNPEFSFIDVCGPVVKEAARRRYLSKTQAKQIGYNSLIALESLSTLPTRLERILTKLEGADLGVQFKWKEQQAFQKTLGRGIRRLSVSILSIGAISSGANLVAARSAAASSISGFTLVWGNALLVGGLILALWLLVELATDTRK